MWFKVVGACKLRRVVCGELRGVSGLSQLRVSSKFPDKVLPEIVGKGPFFEKKLPVDSPTEGNQGNLLVLKAKKLRKKYFLGALGPSQHHRPQNLTSLAL